MRGRERRRERPDVEVAAGERVLAWTVDAEGSTLAGTREALYLPGVRLPWDRVEAVDWDADEFRLRISEVGEWGEQRVEHDLHVEEPGRFLELVRERVTATVVTVRHVPVRRTRGVRVVARRAPTGDREIHWVYEFDEGIDPDDPEVRRLAAEALAVAREDVGEA